MMDWNDQYYLCISQREHVGEDARAAVPDQQMRPDRPRYPVDRYLVESNKKVEMVNIIDDEIWNSEPALRPEDEIILKKLHDMLQSTADDLKLLSGELSKINQPGVHIKSQPTPLDEEFNEKVHIEEIVNAKFHGHKIVEKSLPFSPELKPNKNFVNELLASKTQKPKVVNTSVQVSSTPLLKNEDKTMNLKTTRLKTVHIQENNFAGTKPNLLNNGKSRKNSPTVSYDEVVHKNIENIKEKPKLQLQIQNMPSINIRSELKEQKVLHLDIFPESKESLNTNARENIGVIEAVFESPRIPVKSPKGTVSVTSHNYQIQTQPVNVNKISKKPIRRISKMSTYESSESTNNISSDTHPKPNIQKHLKSTLKVSPKRAGRTEIKNKKNVVTKKAEKRTHLNLDEWKKKLNTIYGQPSSSRSRGTTSKYKKPSPKKSNIVSSTNTKSKTLNNGEYIPYTKLTLGGVNVSDIEREICDIPNKNDLQLSPILDKILSSRESSFHNDSPRKGKHKSNPKVLTTSDENLLQEVMDIEKTVSETLSKEFKETSKDIQLNLQNDIPRSDDRSIGSYADDFEDEKTEQSVSSKGSQQSGSGGMAENFAESNQEENKINPEELPNVSNHNENIQNATYTKALNLSFKDTVDIFEFVHAVDTQETGTQSNSASKISLKETQTSPRNDRNTIQPIRNDLWPSFDPKGEIESLFQLEKEFIKKLIIDEYGDIIENNIMKPSSSKEKDDKDIKNNVAAFQKNTQTSPARVKSAMTSPTKTKTRTTSPFSLSLTVDRQTSPMMAINNEELKIVIENEPDDLGISINLSSPRFSLRLPQNSREVLSNLDNYSRTSSKVDQENIKKTKEPKSKQTVSSSSSVDADNSSSDISSLGEVKLKLKRRIRKIRAQSVSESSSSSVVTQRSSDILSGEILPLKSEGEVSLGQAIRKPSKSRHKESEGELNFRPM